MIPYREIDESQKRLDEWGRKLEEKKKALDQRENDFKNIKNEKDWHAYLNKYYPNTKR